MKSLFSQNLKLNKENPSCVENFENILLKIHDQLQERGFVRFMLIQRRIFQSKTRQRFSLIKSPLLIAPRLTIFLLMCRTSLATFQARSKRLKMCFSLIPRMLLLFSACLIFTVRKGLSKRISKSRHDVRQ